MCFIGTVGSPDQVEVLSRAHHHLRRRKPNSLLPLNMTRLRRLSGSRSLAITRCESADGEILSVHSYILSENRARLFHSISLFEKNDSSARKSLIGRANRFHTWRDILYFRGLDYSIFDMGGFYEGTADAERAFISKFKREFGGYVETGYNAIIARTWWGNLVKRAMAR